MKQDLTKLVVDSTITNNPNSSVSYTVSDFETTDRVFIRSVDEVKRLKDKERTKVATDFALMHGAGGSTSLSYDTNGSHPMPYMLRSPETTSRDSVYGVSTHGKIGTSKYSSVDMGICPVMRLDAKKLSALLIENPNAVKVARVKGDNYVLEMGEYPQTKVSATLETTLESMFNGGKLQGGLQATGRWYTTNGITLGSGFAPHQNPEFIYNGVKYVRTTTTQLNARIRCSDGSVCRANGEAHWVKVEPIRFNIANWRDLPKTINPKGRGKTNFVEIESEKLIIGGISFSPIYQRYASLWQNSFVRAFLNGETSSNLDGYESLGTGIEFDCSYCGFLQQALDLSRAPITEYTIPDSQSYVERLSFSGCVNLQKLTIPTYVAKIAPDAFDGCNFEYAYIDAKTNFLTLSQNEPTQEMATNVIKLSQLNQTINNFSLNNLMPVTAFNRVAELVNVLSAQKLKIPSSLAQDIVGNFRFSLFIKNCDFKFFKAELLAKIEDLISQGNKKYADAVCKAALVLGCFSTEKLKDKNGLDTQTSLAQKASSFLASVVNNNLLTETDFIELFENIPTFFTASPEFIQFLTMQGPNKTFPNLDLLVRLEKQYKGIVAKMLKDFNAVKQMRKSLDENGKPINLSWENAMIKYYTANKYYDVTDETQDIAELFVKKGLSQQDFSEASKQREIAIENNTPHHILGEELKEETILESIERTRQQTQEALQESRILLDDLYAKKFTYEMLDKYDPHNAILGIYCSCCATVTSSFYGRQITEATMTADDVQTLVVRDASGEIVSKGTMYVNKEKGYIVINDFELSEKYRNHEKMQTEDDMGYGGYYDVPIDSEEERDRQMIFDAFMRGVKAFVAEYDRQNPNRPIQIVNVGSGYNRLKRQCDLYGRATQTLTVPERYKFCDAMVGQYTLYTRSNSGQKEI